MRTFFNPLVIGSAFFIAILLLALTVGAFWWTRPDPSSAGPGTAVLNVILAPTVTPAPPTAAPQLTATPGGEIPPPPAEGEVGIGAYVQISGTGGDGLRLRSAPGLEGAILLVGAEAEVFLVKDGPQQVDGYTWWYLVGPYDNERQGWGVANFIRRVQGP